MHYGNGTDAIIRHLGAQEWVSHYTAGREFHSADQAESFFAVLPKILADLCACDVVLYQAGADPHVDDPLGGWLTTEQLRRRDAMVFEAFVKRGVPVAWNLAGGYQKAADGGIPKVLEIHDNTAIECLRVLGGAPAGRADDGSTGIAEALLHIPGITVTAEEAGYRVRCDRVGVAMKLDPDRVLRQQRVTDPFGDPALLLLLDVAGTPVQVVVSRSDLVFQPDESVRVGALEGPRFVWRTCHR